MDRLNVFNPYRDKEPTHEDVLTRNFLILVKNIAKVQATLGKMIKDSLPGFEDCILDGDVSKIKVYTQVVSNTILSDISNHDFISVVISDDRFEGDHEVVKSNRGARYDGVIVTPSYVITIENKPYVKDIWKGQLNPNEKDVRGKSLINRPCCLSWRGIIDALSKLMEMNDLNLLEKTIVDDFLAYVDENYKWLNPYNRFALCKENKYLLDRRCIDILEECFMGKTHKYHKGWKNYIDTSDEDGVVNEVALDTQEDSIVLTMYGGDTMNSARYMYQCIDINKLSELLKKGYNSRANFHIAYVRKNLTWFESNADIIDYVRFWKKGPIIQVKRNEIEDYCEELGRKRIIVPQMEQIEQDISLKQENLNICPGLFFGYSWPIEEAIRLDNEGLFIEECKKKILEIRSVYK